MTPEEIANLLREWAGQGRFRSVREDLLNMSEHLSPRPRRQFEREIFLIRSWREDVEEVLPRMNSTTPTLDLVGKWWEQVTAEVSCVPDDVIGVFDVNLELLDSEVAMTTCPSQRDSTARFYALLTFEYDDTWSFSGDSDAIQHVIYNLGGVKGKFEFCRWKADT